AIAAPTATVDIAGVHAVFAAPTITDILWTRDRPTPPTPATAHLPLAALSVFPGSIGTLAFGTYSSPDYENTSEVIPAVGTATGAPVTSSAGGRGVDLDGNGTIDSTEGRSAIGAQSLIGNSDGLHQTTIDLMQLVRVLEHGVDVDGHGAPDLSTSRIYYAGQS